MLSISVIDDGIDEQRSIQTEQSIALFLQCLSSISEPPPEIARSISSHLSIIGRSHVKKGQSINPGNNMILNSV